jgi:hypothetical protein
MYISGVINQIRPDRDSAAFLNLSTYGMGGIGAQVYVGGDAPVYLLRHQKVPVGVVALVQFEDEARAGDWLEHNKDVWTVIERLDEEDDR